MESIGNKKEYTTGQSSLIEGSLMCVFVICVSVKLLLITFTDYSFRIYLLQNVSKLILTSSGIYRLEKPN